MREYPTIPYLCRVCSDPLRFGHNHTIGQFRNRNYICRPCRRDYMRSRPLPTLLNMVRGRATRKGIPFTLTEADLSIPLNCPILGIPLVHAIGSGSRSNSPTIDRLDPRFGYVPGNVRIISHRANTLKSNHDASEAWAYAMARPDHIDRLKIAVWLNYGVEA